MITFSIALILLLAGYWIYGKFIDRIFSPDPKCKTPAITKADGVDYIPLPTWKIFMIQFLNIAGLDRFSAPSWERSSVRLPIYGL